MGFLRVRARLLGSYAVLIAWSSANRAAVVAGVTSATSSTLPEGVAAGRKLAGTSLFSVSSRGLGRVLNRSCSLSRFISLSIVCLSEDYNVANSFLVECDSRPLSSLLSDVLKGPSPRYFTLMMSSGDRVPFNFSASVSNYSVFNRGMKFLVLMSREWSFLGFSVVVRLDCFILELPPRLALLLFPPCNGL